MPSQLLPVDKETIAKAVLLLRKKDEELAATTVVLKQLAEKNGLSFEQLVGEIEAAKKSQFVLTTLRERYDQPLAAFRKAVESEGMLTALTAMHQAWLSAHRVH